MKFMFKLLCYQGPRKPIKIIKRKIFLQMVRNTKFSNKECRYNDIIKLMYKFVIRELENKEK